MLRRLGWIMSLVAGIRETRGPWSRRAATPPANHHALVYLTSHYETSAKAQDCARIIHGDIVFPGLTRSHPRGTVSSPSSFPLARPAFVASKGNGELQGIDHGR